MIPREEAIKVAKKCPSLDMRFGIFCCPMCHEEDDPQVCCAYCTMYGTEDCTDKNPCKKLKERTRCGNA